MHPDSKTFSVLLSPLFFLLFAVGCQTPGGPVAEVPEKGPVEAVFPAAEYRNLSADEGRVFRVDNAASQVRVFMWRGGPMAAKGHNHVLVVRSMEGAVFIPDDMVSGGTRVDIVFPVAEIAVDPLDLRKQIGGAFTGTGMTEEGARKTRRNMLGEKALDAERFPRIGLSAETVHGELPKLVLDTAITIHGIRRHHLIPATVRVDGETLTAEGAFAIRQTWFGIEPFSAMGGALYVQDPIMVEFEIVARTRT